MLKCYVIKTVKKNSKWPKNKKRKKELDERAGKDCLNSVRKDALE